MSTRDLGPAPYVGKTIAEVVHDYAVTRGDLSEPYAREQLVDLIERRIRQAQRDALTGAAKDLDTLLRVAADHLDREYKPAVPDWLRKRAGRL